MISFSVSALKWLNKTNIPFAVFFSWQDWNLTNMESNSCTTADVARHSSLPEDCVDEETMRIPLAVLYSLIFLVGLVGNILALWVFFCVQSTKNSVHVFLLNVACADLLLIFCLPFRILYHSHGNTWTLSPILCNLVGNLFYMNMYISITLLGLISVDRYLKMHNRAGRRRLLSTKRSVFLCAVIWTVAFLFFLPYMIFQSNTRPGRLVLFLSEVFLFGSKSKNVLKWRLVFADVSTTKTSMKTSGRPTSTFVGCSPSGRYSFL